MTPRRRRRLPLEHVLVAARVDDLDAVRALVALLPEGTYGQVYIASDEHRTSSTEEVAAWLSAPPRMSVTRLSCPTTDPADRTTAMDAALSNAVGAWMSEWIPDEPTSDRLVSVWVSDPLRGIIEPSCLELGCPVERL